MAFPHAPSIVMAEHHVQLKEVLAASRSAICIFQGPEHTYTAVNPVYQDHVFPGTALLGRRVRDVLPDVDAQGLGALLDCVYTTGQAQVGRAWPIPIPGQPLRYFDFMMAALRAADGTISGVYVEAHDVSEAVRTHQALAAVEQEYRTLVEQATEGIFRTSATGALLLANPQLAQIFGYDSVEELLAEVSDVRTQLYADPAEWNVLLRQFETADAVTGFELHGRRRDGDVVWLALSLRASRTNDGTIAEFEGLVTDITERKQAEAQLRFHAHLLDSVGEAVVASDRDGRITYWNRAAEALYGWPAHEVLGRNVVDVTPAERARDEAVTLMQQLATGQPWSGEFLVRRRAGTTFPAQVTDVPIRDAMGEVVGVIGVSRDITERKQAETTQAWLAAIVESSEDAIIGTTLDGIITSWNAGAERLYGYSSADILGRSAALLLPPEVGYELSDNLVRVARGERIRHYETVGVTKAGVRCDVALTISPILNPTAQPVGAAVIAHDISHRKQAEARLRASEERFRSVVQHSSDILTIFADDGTIQYESPAIEPILGYAPSALIGTNALLLVHPDDHPGVRAALATARAHPGHPVSVEYRAQHQDGSWRTVESVGTYHPSESAVTGFVINTRDITERRAAEQALSDSAEYLQALVENSAEIITVLNADGTPRYTSPAQQRLLGYAGQPTSMLAHVHPDDQLRIQQLFTGFGHVPGETTTTELRVQHHDGSWRVFEATGTNLLANPAVRGIVVNSHDITRRKQIEEQLLHDAFHDALTGLPNRALFLDRLGPSLERVRRVPERSLAVMFLDLDRFKTINDSLGHATGDALLVAVARRLTQAVRPGDTVARLGGDEFAILLEELPTTHAAIEVAERIGQAFATPIRIEAQELPTMVSIGIAFSRPDHQRPDELLRDADIAMYSAKRRGPGKYAVADPSMHAALLERLQLEADLRRALEQEEFVLYYQPKMAMDGHTVQGFEALIRWQHPVRGLVPPADFIPLAEETGQIVPLGTWALRRACQQMQHWRAAGFTPGFVAVNLAASQFRQSDLIATLQAILDETGLPPKYLALELTESMLMDDADATVVVLQALRNLGIRALAIDDFGTGYSSLSYLQRFPVTELKIDRSFVRDIGTNPNSEAIAMAIIALAHSLGLEVIAEGVETEAQRAWLAAAGCDRFQGYLVSRPLPAEQLIRFVR